MWACMREFDHWFLLSLITTEHTHTNGSPNSQQNNHKQQLGSLASWSRRGANRLARSLHTKKRSERNKRAQLSWMYQLSCGISTGALYLLGSAQIARPRRPTSPEIIWWGRATPKFCLLLTHVSQQEIPGIGFSDI